MKLTLYNHEEGVDFLPPSSAIFGAVFFNGDGNCNAVHRDKSSLEAIHLAQDTYSVKSIDVVPYSINETGLYEIDSKIFDTLTNDGWRVFRLAAVCIDNVGKGKYQCVAFVTIIKTDVLGRE